MKEISKHEGKCSFNTVPVREANQFKVDDNQQLLLNLPNQVFKVFSFVTGCSGSNLKDSGRRKEEEAKNYDDYSWRVADLELGAKWNDSLSSFVSAGYKVLLSLEEETSCGYTYCVSCRSEDMDLEGITYKAGFWLAL